ncbi:outer membrane beta-barrel protein [Aridibaculum aurantiacum]|uniref:outer membrane beta-barrel protein n=1 Tax=Aridibaculum aurantiacum TaxID=2810307 RepID=UPI001A978F27|nr:outer membrane beta-barrel protein [Aridibaculum aurantiacum]
MHPSSRSFNRTTLKRSLLASYTFLLLSIFTGSFAQQRTVTISVVDNTKQAVPFATTKALLASDTLMVVQKVTDSTGVARFQLQQGAQYILRATSVNFLEAEKKIVVTGDNRFSISLSPAASTLGGVVVTASRPLMRQEDDKTIVDPEALAVSSTNAYEILEKTPGLFVDQDGNVYLSSTTPARIYINGREQRMSAQDLATMLKSLPPNSIQNIEILRTPSARYDASGGGGIVNVVLKKGVRIGLTGSVNAGFNQGRYGNQFAGLNLNNSSGKLSSYINLQYTRRKSYDNIITNRLFAADSLLSQNANTVYPGSSFYIGGGLGYEINKKWEISYDGRLSLNRFDNATINSSQINKISNGQLITSNLANVNNTGTNSTISQAISTKYKIDSLGSEWTNDFSYTGTPGSSHQDFGTFFNQPAREPFLGAGDINTRFNFFSAASNVLWKLPKKLTLEAGVKSTVASFRNTTDFFRQINGNMLPDAVRTAAYRYNENINAAFLQGSKTIAGITLKVGTRLENTNMQGNQMVPKDTSFNIHRTDLFPYVYISRNLMTIMSYELRAYLVYRRTISRPGYELLNPFPRFIDQYMFETGNPSLRPQFTQNYEANISVNERPIFALGVNETKDIFTNVIYQADTSRSLAYRTYDNLGTNKETYFRLIGAIPPGKRYFIVVGGQYNHNFYNGRYENSPLQFKRGSWSIFSYQTLRITPNTQFVLNGFARFNGQLQFYELSSFGALNLSINQQFLKKKLMVSLSATDVFFTNNNNFSLQQGTVNATGYRESDTRRFGLNIRYNFGLRKKEENNFLNIESPEKAQ